MPLFLIPAILSAMAAAGGGIAGAAQAGAQADFAAGQSAQDRALKERLQKQQLAEQQREFGLQQQQQANSNLMNSYSQAGQVANDRAREKQNTTDDIRGTLARAFLSGGR